MLTGLGPSETTLFWPQKSAGQRWAARANAPVCLMENQPHSFVWAHKGRQQNIRCVSLRAYDNLMAALLFYGHLPLQGCFPAALPAPLVIQKWMTNRIVLKAPRLPASVISEAVFNRSESVQGQHYGFGPLALAPHATGVAGEELWKRRGHSSRAKATLFTAPRRLITLSASVAFRLPLLRRVLCGVGKRTKCSFCFFGPARLC